MILSCALAAGSAGAEASVTAPVDGPVDEPVDEPVPDVAAPPASSDEIGVEVVNTADEEAKDFKETGADEGADAAE